MVQFSIDLKGVVKMKYLLRLLILCTILLFSQFYQIDSSYSQSPRRAVQIFITCVPSHIAKEALKDYQEIPIFTGVEKESRQLMSLWYNKQIGTFSITSTTPRRNELCFMHVGEGGRLYLSEIIEQGPEL